MSKLNVVLDIADPCTQSWDQMTAVDSDRYCHSCQKAVVDFTKMSDNELMKWFANRQEHNTCGRLRPDQLQRNMTLPVLPKSRGWVNRSLALITSWLLLTTPNLLNAQQSDGMLLSGRIVDGETKEELIGAQVLIYQDGLVITGSSTDLDGNFSISLSKDLQGKEVDVEVSYIGYNTEMVEIAELTEGREISLSLNSAPEAFLLGAIIYSESRVERVVKWPFRIIRSLFRANNWQ